MSAFLLQQTVIDQIDKFRKLCLWRGLIPMLGKNQRQHGQWYADPKNMEGWEFSTSRPRMKHCYSNIYTSSLTERT
jgi:hypothetical protein